MWHIGIDLHRRTVVMAAVNDSGQVVEPVTIECSQTTEILDHLRQFKPFRAVIEATATYRWLYNLISPEGTVLLAHPTKLRLMIQRRAKTDRLDCQLLANLLRINQIPLSYIPPEEYQNLREITRHRARLARYAAQAKIGLRALLARHNREAPYRSPFGPRGLSWFQQQSFSPVDDMVRDELLSRLHHYNLQIKTIDQRLDSLKDTFPQVESLLDIHGVGLYTALVIIAELGEVNRFRSAKQVGAYAGLTSKVNQSGDHCYYGSITHQGPPWLRWILTEAAIHVVRRDIPLKNFYNRIRKRSGAKKARVAVARKLAEISWKRLLRWQREHSCEMTC
jgi:transposase